MKNRASQPHRNLNAWLNPNLFEQGGKQRALHLSQGIKTDAASNIAGIPVQSKMAYSSVAAPIAHPSMEFSDSTISTTFKTSTLESNVTTIDQPKRLVVEVPPITETPEKPNIVSPVDSVTESSVLPVAEPEPLAMQSQASPITRKFSRDVKRIKHTNPGPTFLSPVLLAQPEVSIDLVQHVETAHPIKSVVNIDWRVQHLHCRLLLPTDHLTLSGVLTAGILYETDEQATQQLMTTVNIPWEKTIRVKFHFPPIMPLTKHIRTFSFVSRETTINTDDDLVTFWEQFDPRSEDVVCVLRMTRIVTTEHRDFKHSRSDICLQANTTFSIDILQNQYIHH